MQIELFLPFIKKTLLILFNLGYGLLAIGVGLAIARFFEKIVTITLKSLKFDSLTKFLKINSVLEKGDLKKSPSELAGGFIFWVAIYLLVAGVAFYSGLPIEGALDKIFSSLSVIFIATVVLSFGTFFALIIGNLVYIVTVNFGLPGSKTISRLAQYATVIVAFLLALEHLGIGSALLVQSIGVIIGALGLAVAIAFGLGCKDMMADFVSNLIKGK